MKLTQKPISFLDIETTGLDQDQHEILEIAVIHPDQLWHTYIKPLDLDHAQPEALAINGYKDHPELWANAPTLTEITDQLIENLLNTVIVGINTQFDMNFIQKALQRSGVVEPRIAYHWIDVATLAYEHLVPCGLQSLSLKNICNFVGVSNEGEHTATADAYRVKAIYEKICRAGVLKRLYWRVTGGIY